MIRWNIIIKKIDQEEIEQHYDELVASLYADRRKKVERYNNKSASYTSIIAGWLLMRAYEKTYKDVPGISGKDIMIVEHEHGKPSIQGREEFKFNISHSGDYVMIAYSKDIGEYDVGADVERIRAKDSDLRVAERFFTEDEFRYVSDSLSCQDEDERFFKIWTMKEAYIKLTGEGLGRRLDSFNVSPDELKITKGAEDISFDMKIYDGHIFTACTDCKDEVLYEYLLDKEALIV